MKKFEYKTIYITKNNQTRVNYLCEILSEQGKLGWELVTVSNDVFIFKRKKEG